MGFNRMIAEYYKEGFSVQRTIAIMCENYDDYQSCEDDVRRVFAECEEVDRIESGY